MTNLVLPQDQYRALMEAGVWKHLNAGGPEGNVYSRSGPGPISKYPAMTAMVERGWFIALDWGWEITPAGEAAAKDAREGRIISN